MKDDDDDVQEYESGWRKRQISNREATNVRNATLEEVAQAFDKMPFGDTSASFAIFVRGMKNDYFC
jgi:hypothetical protein